jgi:glycosyltransferase involved in cell wall biosynthesis
MKRLIFNVTSLVNWYAPPNGIIRANVELCRFLLDQPEHLNNLLLVRFCNDTQDFVSVPYEMIVDAVTRVLSLDKQNYQSLLAQESPFFLHLEQVTDLEDSIFLSMGFDWDQIPPGCLYALKSKGVEIVTFCYYVIPIVCPEYCISRVSKIFSRYISELAWSSSRIYCISKHTINDLARVLSELGTPTPLLKQVVLGSDFVTQTKQSDDLNIDIIERLCLQGKKYLISISTIEPRKNFLTLVQAYKILFDRKVSLPTLVIIGTVGWGDAYQEIRQYLDRHPELNDYIMIVNQLSDVDVISLIIKSLFVLFPSHYEGWGLPVAEALGIGKLVLCSNNSSLPEVAQGCAHLIQTTNADDWANEIETHLGTISLIQSKESHVRQTYLKTTWKEFASSFFADLMI